MKSLTFFLCGLSVMRTLWRPIYIWSKYQKLQPAIPTNIGISSKMVFSKDFPLQVSNLHFHTETFSRSYLTTPDKLFYFLSLIKTFSQKATINVYFLVQYCTKPRHTATINVYFLVQYCTKPRYTATINVYFLLQYCTKPRHTA